MILSYPATSPTLVVEVRNPILGDSVTTPLRSNLHLTMSGMAVTTKRTLGYERLLLTSRTICDPAEIITFIRTAKGADVKLTFNEQDWIGKLLNNPLEIEQELRQGHNVTFEFQGVKQ